MKAAVRKESIIAKITMDLYVIYDLFQGHSGGIPISPEFLNYTLIAYKWKSILERGIIPGGKENESHSETARMK